MVINHFVQAQRKDFVQAHDDMKNMEIVIIEKKETGESQHDVRYRPVLSEERTNVKCFAYNQKVQRETDRGLIEVEEMVCRVLKKDFEYKPNMILEIKIGEKLYSVTKVDVHLPDIYGFFLSEKQFDGRLDLKEEDKTPTWLK